MIECCMYLLMIRKFQSVVKNFTKEGIFMKTSTDMKFEDFKGRKVKVKLVEGSKLSLDDDFMQHEPKSLNERNLKHVLTRLINDGIQDFYRPVCDPSFDSEGDICYEFGNLPAIGRSYNWWAAHAKEYTPQHTCRIGTIHEYEVFLGVLIKGLVAKGWSKKKAWKAVCDDSKDLGHYGNSKNHYFTFERTGSRKVLGYYDLANTLKLLTSYSSSNYIAASSFHRYNGNAFPLSSYRHYCGFDYESNICVGWLIFEN